MSLRFDIEEENFPMVLHVRKGQEAVLDWRLPELVKPKDTPDELEDSYELHWNARESVWEMNYGVIHGMVDAPWNFGNISLEIYARGEPGATTDTTNASYIRDLISRARIKEAIDALENLAQQRQLEDIKDEVTLLSSRFNKNEQERLRGLITDDDYHRSQSQINYAILELLKEVEQYTTVAPSSWNVLMGASVRSVEASKSIIEPEDTLDTDQVYRIKIQEAPTSQFINIFPKGSEKEIKRFTGLYQDKASPYITFVNTETEADYILELNAQEWLVLEPAPDSSINSKLIFGVEKVPEEWAIEKLTENLGKLTKWRQILDLVNPDTSLAPYEVAFKVERITSDGEVVTTYTEPIVEIELEKESNDRYEVVGLQIMAQNRGKRDLFLNVLYLSRSYEIVSINSVALKPGSKELKLFSEGMSINDPTLEEVTDTFKIIISDQELYATIFTQEKIELGEIIAPTRDLVRKERKSFQEWPVDMDWTEQTFTIHLRSKELKRDPIPESAQEPPMQQQQATQSKPEPIRKRLRNWREVRQLIKKGETEKALELSIELAQRYDRKQLYESLMILSGRQKKLQNDINMGIIAEERAQVEQSRITSALLDLTGEEEA